MALLPEGKNGTQWQMTSVDEVVLIIENQGYDNEITHHRFDRGWHRQNIAKYLEEIHNSEKLTEAQKNICFFWLGYFYRSFI